MANHLVEFTLPGLRTAAETQLKADCRQKRGLDRLPMLVPVRSTKSPKTGSRQAADSDTRQIK